MAKNITKFMHIIEGKKTLDHSLEPLGADNSANLPAWGSSPRGSNTVNQSRKGGRTAKAHTWVVPRSDSWKQDVRQERHRHTVQKCTKKKQSWC